MTSGAIAGDQSTSWQDPSLAEIARGSDVVAEVRVTLGGQDEAEVQVERVLKGDPPRFLTVVGFNSYEWNHAYYAMRMGERRVLFLARAGDVYVTPTPSSGNFPHTRGGAKVVGSISASPMRFEVNRQAFLAALEKLLALQDGSLPARDAAAHFATLARSEDIERRYLGVVLLGFTEAADFAPAAIDALRTGTRPLRIAACETLGRLGNEAAVPALIEILSDRRASNREVAMAAADALVAMRAPQVAGALLDWVQRAKKHFGREKRDSPLRAEYERTRARVLGYIGLTATPKLGRRLIELIGHPDPELARAAVESLGQLREAEAVPALINLLDAQNWELRAAAEVALLMITLNPDSFDPPAIRAWYQRHRHETRQQWMAAQRERQIERLRDEDPLVRREAALVMAASGDPGVIFPLKDVLLNSAAGAPLEPAAAPLTLPFLLRRLYVEQGYARARLIAVLRQVLDHWPEAAPLVIPHVASCLVTCDLETERTAALRMLADFPAPTAVPVLIEMLDSMDLPLRRRAVRALRRATGTRLSFRPGGMVPERKAAIERWRNWWEARRSAGVRGSAFGRGRSIAPEDHLPEQPPQAEALGDDDPRIWRPAFAWCVRNPSAHTVLADALQSPRARTRTVAACAAGLAVSNAPPQQRVLLLARLRQQLDDEAALVRIHAAFALCAALPAAPVDDQLRMLASFNPAHELSKLGPEWAALALPPLGASAGQCRALGPFLSDLLQRDASNVRRAAAVAAHEMFGTTLPDDVAQTVLAAALDVPNASVQQTAAAAVGRRDAPAFGGAFGTALERLEEGDIAAPERVAQLLAPAMRSELAPRVARLLESLDVSVRRAGAFLLARQPSARTTMAVLAALADPDTVVRHHGVIAAGKLRLQAAVPTLMQMLYDWEVDLRVAAARALGLIGDPRAVREIHNYLMQANTVYGEHLVALGRLGSAYELRTISQYLKGDRWFGNYYGVKALGYLEHPGVFPILRRYWRDTEEGQFQGHATEALRNQGPRAGPFLLAELRGDATDGTPPAPDGLRARAARLLAECGYEAAVPVLAEVVRATGNPLLRFQAGRALADLLGVEPIEDVDAPVESYQRLLDAAAAR